MCLQDRIANHGATDTMMQPAGARCYAAFIHTTRKPPLLQQIRASPNLSLISNPMPTRPWPFF